MKIYLITDSVDTYTGLRLAGIDGEVVNDPSAAQKAVETALEREDLAVLVLSESIAGSCAAIVSSAKHSQHLPLIVELPEDRRV